MCCSYRVCEEQASAAADQPSSTLGTTINAPTPDEDIFVAVEFSLALPPGFRETEVLPPKPVETRPGFGSFGMQDMLKRHNVLPYFQELLQMLDSDMVCVHHSISF